MFWLFGYGVGVMFFWFDIEIFFICYGNRVGVDLFVIVIEWCVLSGFILLVF